MPMGQKNSQRRGEATNEMRNDAYSHMNRETDCEVPRCREDAEQVKADQENLPPGEEEPRKKAPIRYHSRKRQARRSN